VLGPRTSCHCWRDLPALGGSGALWAGGREPGVDAAACGRQRLVLVAVARRIGRQRRTGASRRIEGPWPVVGQMPDGAHARVAALAVVRNVDPVRLPAVPEHAPFQRPALTPGKLLEGAARHTAAARGEDGAIGHRGEVGRRGRARAPVPVVGAGVRPTRRRPGTTRRPWCHRRPARTRLMVDAPRRFRYRGGRRKTFPPRRTTDHRPRTMDRWLLTADRRPPEPWRARRRHPWSVVGGPSSVICGRSRGRASGAWQWRPSGC